MRATPQTTLRLGLDSQALSREAIRRIQSISPTTEQLICLRQKKKERKEKAGGTQDMTTNDVHVCVHRCPTRLERSTNKGKSQVKMAFRNLKALSSDGFQQTRN